jgi:DNA-binding SARP family transcriptional activator
MPGTGSDGPPSSARPGRPRDIRFGVLGPVVVWSPDGTQARVPEQKVRAVLARLLVDPGRPVSADQLIEDLWGNDPPVDPANALQGKISRLRRALDRAAPGGRELIGFQAGAYTLRVDPGAVDAGRFREQLATASTVADHRGRAALLSDALASWRGLAFADVGDEPFATTAVARLEEERLLAVEGRAEARLALGEHVELIGELTHLVAHHPLRERLRAAHMRALYRGGRRADALRSFLDLRNRLADELGIDPGPELTRLYQTILRRALDGDGGGRTAPRVHGRGRRPTRMLLMFDGCEHAVETVAELVAELRRVEPALRVLVIDEEAARR